MSEELKSCPMCGGKASFSTTTYAPRKHPNAWFADGTPITVAHAVSCQYCGVNNRGLAGGYQTQKEAADRWNTRVRAECAADTRRLEWLAKHACYYNIAPENQGIPDWKDLSETDFRAAIDAAMEGGNG